VAALAVGAAMVLFGQKTARNARGRHLATHQNAASGAVLDCIGQYTPQRPPCTFSSALLRALMMAAPASPCHPLRRSPRRERPSLFAKQRGGEVRYADRLLIGICARPTIAVGDRYIG